MKHSLITISGTGIKASCLIFLSRLEVFRAQYLDERTREHVLQRLGFLALLELVMFSFAGLENAETWLQARGNPRLYHMMAECGWIHGGPDMLALICTDLFLLLWTIIWTSILVSLYRSDSYFHVIFYVMVLGIGAWYGVPYVLFHAGFSFSLPFLLVAVSYCSALFLGICLSSDAPNCHLEHAIAKSSQALQGMNALCAKSAGAIAALEQSKKVKIDKQSKELNITIKLLNRSEEQLELVSHATKDSSCRCPGGNHDKMLAQSWLELGNCYNQAAEMKERLIQAENNYNTFQINQFVEQMTEQQRIAEAKLRDRGLSNEQLEIEMSDESFQKLLEQSAG